MPFYDSKKPLAMDGHDVFFYGEHILFRGANTQNANYQKYILYHTNGFLEQVLNKNTSITIIYRVYSFH